MKSTLRKMPVHEEIKEENSDEVHSTNEKETHKEEKILFSSSDDSVSVGK